MGLQQSATQTSLLVRCRISSGGREANPTGSYSSSKIMVLEKSNPVVPSGLDFSNTMILLDEYDPVGFASRPPLEILQRTSNEVCVADCCRPMVQRAGLRYLRLRVGHPPPPLKSCALV